MESSDGATLYAKALFQLLEDKTREKSILLFHEMQETLQNHPLIYRYFTHPGISLKKKREIMERWIPNKLLLNFFLLLIKKGKLDQIHTIGERLSDFNLAYRGEGLATLITPFPLPAHTLLQLKERLEKSEKKRFLLEEKSDPKIIGGGILFVGKKMSDFSVKGRLQRLATQLRGTDVNEAR